MSGRTGRVAELKSRLKRELRKKQRIRTTKDVMAMSKGEVKASDKALPLHDQGFNWWGNKADHARTKKPHRPNDERKKFYYHDDIREYGKPKFYDAYLLYKE